jgi:hypothetical protein
MSYTFCIIFGCEIEFVRMKHMIGDYTKGSDDRYGKINNKMKGAYCRETRTSHLIPTKIVCYPSQPNLTYTLVMSVVWAYTSGRDPPMDWICRFCRICMFSLSLGEFYVHMLVMESYPQLNPTYTITLVFPMDWILFERRVSRYY